MPTDAPRVDRDLTALEELELIDLQAEIAGLDEERTMFDPDVHPRDHRASDPDEPVADGDGEPVDMMDAPAVEEDELLEPLTVEDVVDEDIDF